MTLHTPYTTHSFGTPHHHHAFTCTTVWVVWRYPLHCKFYHPTTFHHHYLTPLITLPITPGFDSSAVGSVPPYSLHIVWFNFDTYTITFLPSTTFLTLYLHTVLLIYIVCLSGGWLFGYTYIAPFTLLTFPYHIVPPTLCIWPFPLFGHYYPRIHYLLTQAFFLHFLVAALLPYLYTLYHLRAPFYPTPFLPPLPYTTLLPSPHCCAFSPHCGFVQGPSPVPSLYLPGFWTPAQVQDCFVCLCPPAASHMCVCNMPTHSP